MRIVIIILAVVTLTTIIITMLMAKWGAVCIGRSWFGSYSLQAKKGLLKLPNEINIQFRKLSYFGQAVFDWHLKYNDLRTCWLHLRFFVYLFKMCKCVDMKKFPSTWCVHKKWYTMNEFSQNANKKYNNRTDHWLLKKCFS